MAPRVAVTAYSRHPRVILYGGRALRSCVGEM